MKVRCRIEFGRKVKNQVTHMSVLYSMYEQFVVQVALVLVMTISRCLTSRMDILCYGGLQIDYQNGDGYVLDHIDLPYLGEARITIVLPPEWNLVYCCHRMEIRFNYKDLTAQLNASSEPEAMFVLFVRWTICSPDLSHWKCVARWQHGVVSGANTRDNQTARNKTGIRINQGAWSLALQQCLDPVSYVAAYDLGVQYQPVSRSPDIVYQSPHSVGNHSIESQVNIAAKLDHNRDPGRPYEAARPNFCVLQAEGKQISREWTILHKHITLSAFATLCYKFSFTLDVPTNSEIFRLYFISDGGERSLSGPVGFGRTATTTTTTTTTTNTLNTATTNGYTTISNSYITAFKNHNLTTVNGDNSNSHWSTTTTATTTTTNGKNSVSNGQTARINGQTAVTNGYTATTNDHTPALTATPATSGANTSLEAMTGARPPDNVFGNRSIPTDQAEVVTLSIGNSWSGCGVDNPLGGLRYLCEGGQTFRLPVTLTIGLMLCSDWPRDDDVLASISLNYSLEFYGAGVSSDDCRLYGEDVLCTGSSLHQSQSVLGASLAFGAVIALYNTDITM